jgi:hypothetical protein
MRRCRSVVAPLLLLAACNAETYTVAGRWIAGLPTLAPVGVPTIDTTRAPVTFDLALGGFTADSITGTAERGGVSAVAGIAYGDSLRLEFQLGGNDAVIVGLLLGDVINARFWWVAQSFRQYPVQLSRQ